MQNTNKENIEIGQYLIGSSNMKFPDLQEQINNTEEEDILSEQQKYPDINENSLTKNETQNLINKLTMENKLLKSRIEQMKINHKKEVEFLLKAKNKEIQNYLKMIKDKNIINIEKYDKNHNYLNSENKYRYLLNENEELQIDLKNKENLIKKLNNQINDLKLNNTSIDEDEMEKIINENEKLLLQNEKLTLGIENFNQKVKETSEVFRLKIKNFYKIIYNYKKKLNEYKNKIIILKNKINQLNKQIINKGISSDYKIHKIDNYSTLHSPRSKHHDYNNNLDIIFYNTSFNSNMNNINPKFHDMLYRKNKRSIQKYKHYLKSFDK